MKQLLKLLKSEPLEDRVKICFILAGLVSDDVASQVKAGEMGFPGVVIGILRDVIVSEDKGDIGVDLASKAKEVR
jgi:hypothetical protein